MIVAQDFLDHWKTRQLVGLLGGDECAPLYVLRLWAHCQARKTHKFPQLSAESLAGICRFTGAPSALWLAFQTCGFSEVKGEVFIAHQWDQYNKSLTNSWKNGRYGGRKRKPTGIPTAPPNGTHGGVEKRREEKSINTPSASGGARERNPLFDELALIHGANPMELTKPAAREIGVALAAIRQACPNLTVEELHLRAASYRRAMPSAKLSASALAKWWANCGQSAPIQTTLLSAEPSNFREVS
jgi:hypothetical protein